MDTTLSSALARISPSRTNAMTDRAIELRAAGYDIISLSVGEPDFPTPAHVVEACKAALDAGDTRYTAVAGTLALLTGAALGWFLADERGALACVLLAFLMMITRSKAVPQVIAFLAMENGLFFAATSATYGMPMVVELGIALDVMVGMVILGVFFFQIREQFDSLDIRHMEREKEKEGAKEA
jgi:hypothetical protein